MKNLWVNKMSETLLLILLSVGMGFYHDANKPTEYALSMEDGSKTHIILQKNSQYACPLHCGVDHVHHAIVYENNDKINDYKSVYHISKIENNDFALYCSFQKILSMSKMTPGSAKKDMPDVVSASKEK